MQVCVFKKSISVIHHINEEISHMILINRKIICTVQVPFMIKRAFSKLGAERSFLNLINREL